MFIELTAASGYPVTFSVLHITSVVPGKVTDTCLVSLSDHTVTPVAGDYNEIRDQIMKMCR